MKICKPSAVLNRFEHIRTWEDDFNWMMVKSTEPSKKTGILQVTKIKNPQWGSTSVRENWRKKPQILTESYSVRIKQGPATVPHRFEWIFACSLGLWSLLRNGCFKFTIFFTSGIMTMACLDRPRRRTNMADQRTSSHFTFKTYHQLSTKTISTALKIHLSLPFCTEHFTEMKSCCLE